MHKDLPQPEPPLHYGVYLALAVQTPRGPFTPPVLPARVARRDRADPSPPVYTSSIAYIIFVHLSLSAFS